MANEHKTWRELRDDFLNYTRSERNGIFVLIGMIILLNCLNLYCKYFRVVEYDYSDAIAEIDAAYADAKVPQQDTISLFPFNPNQVTGDEMLKLGFKERAIKTFLKYRSSGAKFRNLNDFERVYSIDSLDIERVKDFIFFEEPTTKKDFPKTTKKQNKKSAYKPPTPLFEFDPNTVSEEELKKLGVAPRVVKTMLNFRSKATFKKPADMAKIYGLSKEKFETLLPYIKIEKKKYTAGIERKYVKDSTLYKSEIRKKYARRREDTVAYKSIDINNATEEEWQRIDGIGAVYASMINKYRSKLGGFFTVSQIGETYGIPDSVYQKIVPFVKSSSPKNKMQINLIITDSLARHPYLTWKQAKVITNYRRKHGLFTSPEQIAKVKIFTKEKWERIVPYLDYGTAVDTFDHDIH